MGSGAMLGIAQLSSRWMFVLALEADEEEDRRRQHMLFAPPESLDVSRTPGGGGRGGCCFWRARGNWRISRHRCGRICAGGRHLCSYVLGRRERPKIYMHWVRDKLSGR
jgi:hypothetical protein